MKNNHIPQKFNTNDLPLAHKSRVSAAVQKPVQSLSKDDLRELVLYTEGTATFSIDRVEIAKDGLFKMFVDGSHKFLEVSAGTLVKVYKK